MKNLLSIQLLLIILFMTDCRKKEENLIPQTVVTNPLIPIKDFYLDAEVGSTISTVEISGGDSQNQIIMILPETFAGDEISPIIVLSGDAESISPKSGEKVFFEGKPPVEYTLTKKDGKIEKYFLFVQRKGELKAELLTKEIEIEPNISSVIEFKLANTGTKDIPTRSNSMTATFYDESGNVELFSLNVQPNEKHILSFQNLFPKSKNYRIGLTKNSLEKQYSVTFPLTIKRGKNKYVEPIYRIVQGFEQDLRAVNLDSKNQYTIRFENDFNKNPITFPMVYVEENRLKVNIPTSLEKSGYRVSILENDVKLTSIPEVVVGEDWQLLSVPAFYKFKNPTLAYNYQNVESLSLYSLKQGETFLSFFRQFNCQQNGEIKLINFSTKKEYLLKGECIGGGGETLYFRKFIIPETIPIGDYEVYGILKGETSARYSRKLEITQ